MTDDLMCVHCNFDLLRFVFFSFFQNENNNFINWLAACNHQQTKRTVCIFARLLYKLIDKISIFNKWNIRPKLDFLVLQTKIIKNWIEFINWYNSFHRVSIYHFIALSKIQSQSICEMLKAMKKKNNVDCFK